jgi:heterodisulfide reductase subunit D
MNSLNIPLISEDRFKDQPPDVLFWVGCAGSFDSRAQKIAIAFSKILSALEISFAILGKEEMCTGDPVRRAGNEFLFQMMALQNIAMLQNYKVRKIVTICPHCFNVLKNEYPEIGGDFQVYHYTEFLHEMNEQGKIQFPADRKIDNKVVFHDPCYLGRANNIYNAPRDILNQLTSDLVELERSRNNSFCCGGGGAQVFKEEEKGIKRVNQERVDEILKSKPEIIAISCPFCSIMLEDGIKAREKQDEVMVYDITEMIIQNNNW